MLIGLPVQKFGLGKLGTYYLANNIDVFAFEAYRGTTLQSDSSQFESILQKVGVSFQRGKKILLRIWVPFRPSQCQLIRIRNENWYLEWLS